MLATIVLPPISELAPICERHHISRLRLFGSTARGENRVDSDVDLLVDFETGHIETLESLDRLESDLSDLFDGRRIDLVKPQLLHWFIRDSVLASGQTIYER
jgi:predicted nucleotidyltransferase